ncbi:MAG: alpha/beta hydrolase [Oceanospirillaceae bacterium]|nr:alpha/beta hydrolase [Oceanospirillaceae bacterium]
MLFAHANGFPPSAYKTLLDDLGKDNAVIAPYLRPLWQELTDFQSQFSDRMVWQQMAKDQNDFIEKHHLAPVVCIGHSMGANVSVLAAQLKPHLYQRLILIEPVFLRQTIARIIRFGPRWLINKAPIVAKALRRPEYFATLKLAYDFHRSKRVFSGIADTQLWHYINAAFVPSNAGVKLLYSKYWEAVMYASVPNIWPYLKRSLVPIYVLRGESSDTVDDLAWKRWKALENTQNLPDTLRAINFKNTSHLLPLECPKEVASQVKRCVNNGTF